MGFSIKTVAHAFSTVFHDIVIGFKATESFVVTHKDQIEGEIATVGGIASIIPGLGPTAAVLTRASEAAFGVIADGIVKIDKDLTAAAQSGVTAPVTFTVTLEHDVALEFQQLVAAIKGSAAGASIPTVSSLAAK